jgi:hypothetical protein
MSGRAPPSPVIAPTSGTPEQRLQQVADAISQTNNMVQRLQSQMAQSGGVTDGSDAKPGEIGEFIFANRTTALSVGIATTTDLTSITLSPGDWDVTGAVSFQGDSYTGGTDLHAWVNTVSATEPSGDTGGKTMIATSAAGLYNLFPIPPLRVSSASSVTIYLSCYTNYGAGTMLVKGMVRARRMR